MCQVEMRVKLGLSQGKVAAAAKVSDETIRQLEGAKVFSPRQAAFAGLVWSTLLAMLEQQQG